MTPGSILGDDEGWYQSGIGALLGGNTNPHQQAITTAGLNTYALPSWLISDGASLQLKPEAKPECDEFTWLRKRVAEVSWNTVKA